MEDGEHEATRIHVKLYRPRPGLPGEKSDLTGQTDVDEAIQIAQSFIAHQKHAKDLKIVRATSLKIVRASEMRL